MIGTFETGVRSWGMRRLPPLSRIGWGIASYGTSRPTTQTILGVGLIGAGFVLRRSNRRKVLYRGHIRPGSGTHIRVYKGNRSIFDSPLGG